VFGGDDRRVSDASFYFIRPYRIRADAASTEEDNMACMLLLSLPVDVERVIYLAGSRATGFLLG